MTWRELKNRIYFEDGSLRDVYVLNTNEKDLARWTELINENYLVRFHDAKEGSTTDRISFNAVKETWSTDNRELVTATVKIVGIDINCHFYDHSELEGDIDPREFRSLNDHENLVKYLKDVSNLLGKEVIVTGENTKDWILMRVIGDEVILNSV
ncbi:MAG TPA: hypothetical protein VK658_24690 [Chryseolinea sp.]|nr:hypothetical protein [Chryseolinea sp.]